MSTQLLDGNIDSILQAVIKKRPERIVLFTPGAQTIESVIDLISQQDTVAVSLLSKPAPMKEATADFSVASVAADLEQAGRLELRTVTDTMENAVILTENEVIAVIDLFDGAAGLTSENQALVERVWDSFDQQWAISAPFSHRTPALSEVRNTLSDEIGADVRKDFDAILEALESSRGATDIVDEVAISLLAAARHETLLYDISKWGEDVGVASKATFSRTKTVLERKGLLDTEKVPIDVGRPRLRLILAEEQLRTAPPDELANVALSILQ